MRVSFDEGGWGIGRAFIRRWWWCGARDGCSFKKAVGMVRVGATGGASKARMPEMNAQRL